MTFQEILKFHNLLKKLINKVIFSGVRIEKEPIVLEIFFRELNENTDRYFINVIDTSLNPAGIINNDVYESFPELERLLGTFIDKDAVNKILTTFELTSFKQKKILDMIHLDFENTVRR